VSQYINFIFLYCIFFADNRYYNISSEHYEYAYSISFYHRCGQTFQQQIILTFEKCGSRYKLINPIGRISERLLRASWKAMTRIYLETAKPFRDIVEKNENTERIPKQREKVGRKEMHGGAGREDEAREGEGDATRLINRHADNHSGFMVTTDYQVVQGGIFHIRDVTLFQWGNTCSARYKLHERAYTVRHMCCIVSATS
jgi:hypothetical protein